LPAYKDGGVAGAAKESAEVTLTLPPGVRGEASETDTMKVIFKHRRAIRDLVTDDN
jgi:hypothetical protein